jgi:hypothetical protein
MIVKGDSMTILCKGTYLHLIAIMIALAAAVYASDETQRNGENQMFYRFPADSIQCVPGDYILTKSTQGWTAYLVQDLFFMSRLVPMKDSSGLSVVEQITVADSATPPKWREIQLLVSEYKRPFGTREEAISAIKSKTLGDSIQGLCRSINEFHKETSIVYRP